ncbi:MAG: hypothetical protein M0Z55_10105 [Peptococcaceae bacterium]|nr:hypothetical protein [Peptococcaceae bacterium]
MNILLIIIVLVGVLALVLYPLFRGTRGEEYQEFKRVRPTWVDDKEALANTLGEIEFDYHMNKLSEEDYTSLKNNYAVASKAIAKEEEDETGFKGKSRDKRKAKGVSPAAGKINVADIELEIEAELEAIGNADSEAKCHRCGTTLKDAGQEHCHACGERQF